MGGMNGEQQQAGSRKEPHAPVFSAFRKSHTMPSRPRLLSLTHCTHTTINTSTNTTFKHTTTKNTTTPTNTNPNRSVCLVCSEPLRVLMRASFVTSGSTSTSCLHGPLTPWLLHTAGQQQQQQLRQQQAIQQQQQQAEEVAAVVASRQGPRLRKRAAAVPGWRTRRQHYRCVVRVVLFG